MNWNMMYIFHQLWKNILKAPSFPWDFNSLLIYLFCHKMFLLKQISAYSGLHFWILWKFKFKTSKQAIYTTITFVWFWSKPWKFLVPPRNDELVQVAFEIQLWGPDLPIWFARIPPSSPDPRASPHSKALLQLERVHATQSPSPLCGGHQHFSVNLQFTNLLQVQKAPSFCVLKIKVFLAIH